jgi:hypothetical protein
VTVVWTADRVGITAGLRVWVLPRPEPGLYVWALPHEPGTVDLTTAVTPAGRDPVVRVDLDFGRSVIVTAAMVAACHPRTGQRPPGLGICRWVGTCAEPAVRMVPHPLMSPVPTCGSCAASGTNSAAGASSEVGMTVSPVRGCSWNDHEAVTGST